MSVAVAILAVASCLGYGAVLLHACRLDGMVRTGQRLAWSFGLGFGVLGWLVFFLGAGGWLARVPLLAVLLLGAAGMVALKDISLPWPAPPQGWDYLILGALAVVLLLDLLVAMAPPADADTLAYHFELPRRFIERGAIFFVPRAVDGAAPLLSQMTYVPVLALGGERALTLWTMLSGWGAAAMVFALSRTHLSVRWSGIVVLAFLTTPAVLFGAGSGQVEIRNTMFVLLAAWCLAEALRTGLLRFVVLAGLAAGFFVGSKYLGLLFAAACVVVVLMGRDRFVRAAAFSLAVAIGGFQWYLWNWIQSGDPIFPFLIGHFGIGDSSLWPSGFQAWFDRWMVGSERAVARDPFWFLAYPFVATFAGLPIFESGRTGFGPLIMVLLPVTLWGAWHRRDAVVRSPFLSLAIVALLFYALWFLTGSSQRVRHLLPIYPLVVMAAMAAAIRAPLNTATQGVLAAGIGAAILIQMGGQTVFAANYVRHLASGETRGEFLERNVVGYEAARWINAHLSPDDTVMLASRELAYLIEPNTYVAHDYKQALVDLRESADDVGVFLRQLKRLGITYVMFDTDGSPHRTSIRRMAEKTIAAGCAVEVATVPLRVFESRTLPTAYASSLRGHFVKIGSYECS